MSPQWTKRRDGVLHIMKGIKNDYKNTMLCIDGSCSGCDYTNVARSVCMDRVYCDRNDCLFTRYRT